MISTTKFKKAIWDYYRQEGRVMPWRRTRDPYRILVSEIMLQQTQVSRVLDFYKKFIAKFPDFKSLINAKTGDVLRAWQGLGYNRRALALQKLAKVVTEKHRGKLPRDTKSLVTLPGVGPYTAGAIRAFAFNEPEIFIETNIRRVFIHFFFPRKKKVTDGELERYIKRTLDGKNPREWYFALMDYGAMLGTAARAKNPNRRSAHYARQSVFVGSDRELRGKILRVVLSKKKISKTRLWQAANEPALRFKKVLDLLLTEGFLEIKGEYVRIK